MGLGFRFLFLFVLSTLFTRFAHFFRNICQVLAIGRPAWTDIITMAHCYGPWLTVGGISQPDAPTSFRLFRNPFRDDKSDMLAIRGKVSVAGQTEFPHHSGANRNACV